VAAELVSETFEGRVGERFGVRAVDGEPFEVTLTACEVSSDPAAEAWRERVGRMPFSLIFEAGPGDAWPQQIFTLTHPDVGELTLFLVPLGPGGNGMTYQAVIN
jgi:hypothetical protein